MGRKPCCDKIGLKRGPWTIEEDRKLVDFILNNGILCWRTVPKLAGLLRCGKSCRLRWINYLRPDLKRGGFTETEENEIIKLHSNLGNRWSKIASHFPGRTDNEIKNHWNTRIKKKLKQHCSNPVTHEPTQQSNIDITDVRIKDSSDQSESSAENLDRVEEDKTAKYNATEDLMKNYELLCGSWDLLETNSNSYKLSVEDSDNSSGIIVPAVGESCPLIENEDWLDQATVDSIRSWDYCFDFLHNNDDTFYLQNTTQF